jgi:osmoprotectant transport system substrate-binding protein
MQGMLRAILALIAVLALGGGLAACGDDDGSADSQAGADRPGAGKPRVTLGTKNFTEQFVLGQLYKQALEAKGFTVALKQNIGSTEIADKALRSGQIDLYPEYIGIFNTAVAGDTTAYPDVEAAFAAGKAYAERNGFTLLPLTPFTNTDALAVKPAYAQANELQTVADLKGIDNLRLGAPPEFRQRQTGLVGLERVYGISGVEFSPLTIGLQYEALDDGKIDVADVFTTDGQLQRGDYVVLEDPENVFGFQNVAPVVRTEVLDEQGAAFRETLEALDALLTTEAMQRMNAAVDIDKQSPADVAREFLEANELT